MFFMKTLYSFIALLLLTASIAAQSNDRNSKIQSEIREVIEAQSAAWNRGDVEGFMAGYWRSPELVFVSGDNVTRGWQQTLDRYKKSYNTREKMGTLVFSDLEFFILSKDAAVVLGNWALTRQGDNPHGKFTLTFRKLKEGWRIVMDHTS
jgi:ketosteroid isomerase-like protein